MIQSNVLLRNLARNISAGFKMEVLSTMDVVMNNVADKENNESPMKKQRLMQLEPVLKVAKLSEHAIIPSRGSKQAAGFDLYSAYDAVVKGKDKAIVKTDIQIALPDHCYGRVAPRSGLAVKSFIDVGAGVIDQDYRGNVGVVLFNFGNEDFIVKRGDRIAQLICERIFTPDIEVLESLADTERGSGGYGSTGKS